MDADVNYCAILPPILALKMVLTHILFKEGCGFALKLCKPHLEERRPKVIGS